MRKYIPFQLIIMAYVCNTLYIHAMEPECIPLQPCYLAMLPADVWDCIAQFLLWETEEEFIARTEREKDEQFPKEYYKYFGCEDDLGIENLFGVFSPDKNKIAILEKFGAGCTSHDVCDNCADPLLVIVDLKEEKQEDKTLFVGTLNKRCYRAIGLSVSGNMYATIKKTIKNKDVVMPSQRDYQDMLVIHNMITNNDHEFEITDGFYVSHVMFNKQGTCVIAHARDFSCDPMKKNYLLFDLKDNNKEKNTANEIVIVENKDEKKRLLDYFRHYRVCKEIKGIENYYG